MSQFLQTMDVAKLLNCSVENVRALERSGKLSAIKTPTGRRIFRGEEVERFAQERAQAKEQKAAQAA
jgi:excisionase family DNA binding protein